MSEATASRSRGRGGRRRGEPEAWEFEEVAREIEGLGRGDAAAITAHVGGMDDIRQLASKDVGGQFGRIDIRVNNAVVSPAMVPVLEAGERLWDAVMNVNLKGLFFLSQVVARAMKETGGGTEIINVSSVSGCIEPISKSASTPSARLRIIMATKVMALDGPAWRGLRVNAIAPGQRPRRSPRFL